MLDTGLTLTKAVIMMTQDEVRLFLLGGGGAEVFKRAILYL